MALVWRPEAIPNEQHFVYAMLCQDGDGPGYVKFGRSGQIGVRLTSLRSSCPIPARYFAVSEMPSMPASRKVERLLHRHFKDRRVTGEWYRFDFDSVDDKRAFNEGCRLVFSVCLGRAPRWTKISVRQLDQHEAHRRKTLTKAKGGIKALRALGRYKSQADKSRQEYAQFRHGGEP